MSTVHYFWLILLNFIHVKVIVLPFAVCIQDAFVLYFMLKIRDKSIIMVFIAQYNGLEPIM